MGSKASHRYHPIKSRKRRQHSGVYCRREGGEDDQVLETNHEQAWENVLKHKKSMMSQKMGELIMSSRESTSLQFQLMIMDSVIPTYSINEALVQEMQNEGQRVGCPIQRTYISRCITHNHTGPAQHVATLQDMHTDGMNRCKPSLNFSCSSPLYSIHGQHRGWNRCHRQRWIPFTVFVVIIMVASIVVAIEEVGTRPGSLQTLPAPQLYF